MKYVVIPMLGALVVVGVFAFLTSTAATLSNMVIKRVAETNSLDIDLSDLPVVDAYQLAAFMQAARVFHRQALMLWLTFAVMLSIGLLMDFYT